MCAQEEDEQKQQKMDKLRLKVYEEVLKDMSAHFDGSEKLIEEKIEETCPRGKISVEKIIYHLILALWYVVKLPIVLKMAVCCAMKGSTQQKKLRRNELA